MKRITYSGGSFLTSNEIADELMSLTANLGRLNTAQTVDIPVVNETGDVEVIELVVGPASQLTSRAETSAYGDPIDETALSGLRTRIALLDPAKPVSESPAQAGGTFDELGEL